MAKSKISFFGRIVVLLNILAVISLLLSYLAGFVSPAKYWFLGLFGLAYPIILLINILFVIYWILGWRLHFLLSLVAILIGYSIFCNTFQFPTSKKVLNNKGQMLKVMSYNTRIFDLYNWTKEKPNQIKDKIFSLFGTQHPDILCIQEYCEYNTANGNNTQDIQKRNSLRYHYTEYTETLSDSLKFGITTFSRFPIVGQGRIDFAKSYNLCIFTDLLINQDTVRVYNVHFQSIRFEKEDYKFVENISENKNQEEIQGSKKILRRLKKGFLKRAEQVEMVAAHIRSCKHRIIICGDFNDTPSSYTYHTIRGDLKDAFVESGSGIGNTYNGTFPSFRIDYILHDRSFESTGFGVIKKKYSDHFPVVCRIALPLK